MASENITGFSVTPARVGFLLSLIALATASATGITWFMDMKYQVKAHDQYVIEDKANTKEILGEIKGITRKVDELTFIVRANQPSKQANVFDTPSFK